MMTRALIFFSLMIFIQLQTNASGQVRDPSTPLNTHVLTHTKTPVLLDNTEVDIQGLFISKSKRIALIDNKFYVVGDMTNIGQLVAVFKDRVVIRQNDDMRVFFMSKQNIRQDK